MSHYFQGRDVVSPEHGSYNFQSRKAVTSVAAIVEGVGVDRELVCWGS